MRLRPSVPPVPALQVQRVPVGQSLQLHRIDRRRGRARLSPGRAARARAERGALARGRGHPLRAEDVRPQVVRGERLHGGEHDVVDAGHQLQEDVVGEAEGVPVRHDHVLEHAEHEDLDDPRGEVPERRDHVPAKEEEEDGSFSNLGRFAIENYWSLEFGLASSPCCSHSAVCLPGRAPRDACGVGGAPRK